MSRSSRALSLALIGFGLFGSVLVVGRPIHARSKPAYRQPFGTSRFLPSQATTADGRFLPSAAFNNAAYCGRCHQQEYAEWRESAHSNSFREPFYTRNVNLLIKQKGIEYTRHCEGCHNPVALLSGALTSGSTEKRPFDNEGVTCSVCHSIQSVRNLSGTGAYVMGTPAVIVDERGSPITHAVSDDEIRQHLDRHKQAVMRDVYGTPEYCSTCHKASIPRTLNDYKWLRAFDVYGEWQASAFANESAAPFYTKDRQTCQTCHMPIASGEAGLRHTSHRWLGANTAIPKFYGFTRQSKAVEDFLKSGIVAIDIFGLDRAGAAMQAPLSPAVGSITPGETLTANIVLQNKGIGHSFVPEQRDFYEAWVQCEVLDAHGTALLRSGGLDARGNLEHDAHSYTNRLVGANGELLELHQVWNSRTRPFEATIGAGRSDLVRYRFIAPAQDFTLRVTLNYRRFRKNYTDFALRSKQRYPVVEIAASETHFHLHGAAQSTTASPIPESMRWNNYGIALLERGQHDGAAAAFRKELELTPAADPVHINLAIAHTAGQNYEAALEQLEIVLRAHPANTRALYYRAVAEDQSGALSLSREDLKKVVAQFPRMLAAHTLLAAIDYELRDYDQAIVENKLLQRIDPDDLSAHYNLTLLYRKKGRGDLADDEARLFEDEKQDDTMRAVGHDLLLNAPEVEAESVSWHVHDLHRIFPRK